jgi:hypothetical protein
MINFISLIYLYSFNQELLCISTILNPKATFGEILTLPVVANLKFVDGFEWFFCSHSFINARKSAFSVYPWTSESNTVWCWFHKCCLNLKKKKWRLLQKGHQLGIGCRSITREWQKIYLVLLLKCAWHILQL